MNHEEHWTQHNHEQLDELQAKLFEVLDRTLAAHDRIALLTNQLLAKLDALTEEAGKDKPKSGVAYGPERSFFADPVEGSKPKSWRPPGGWVS